MAKNLFIKVVCGCTFTEDNGIEFCSIHEAAPQMLIALENLENDDGSIPDHAWKMVQNAIGVAERDMV